MSNSKEQLLALAKQAAAQAYAPYSQFPVGAVVSLKNDQTVIGCNVENASFGMTVCAERNAISAAAVQGARPGDITELVLFIDRDELFSPCGACRQVIREFMPIDATITAYNAKGDHKTWTVAGLLPDSFQLPD